MKERICLAPGANGTELIKSLAMHGVNCFNLRIVGDGELAHIAMMRSGISTKEDFVSSREEIAIVSEAVKGIEYFGKTTYSDIQQIASCIRRMRCLVPGDDESDQIEKILSKGIFSEKNDALIRVYKNYIKIIKDKKLVDQVSLIRKAASECKELDADFFILKEYPVNPLEKSLLIKLSGGHYSESDIAELFGLGESKLKIRGFKKCYGAPNEVETILTDIYSGKKLDRCTVAVTDPGVYGQLFLDYALLYDMPISFGCGIPIINSNPARLLVLYYKWLTGGFFGAYSLNEMLSSKAFDLNKLYELYPETDENFSWGTYSDVLGGLRLTNDEEINKKRLADFKKAISEEEEVTDPEDEKAVRNLNQKKLCIPYLEVLAKELALPTEEFIVRYSYIRKGSETNSQKLLMMLDLAANKAIFDELRVIRASGIEQATDDMIMNVLKIGVAGGRSEEGKLYVTSVDGALSSLRDNLYIAGLSASNYPGSPKENYLLLDSDIRLFGDVAEYMTSDGRVNNKRDRLLALAGLASGIGAAINVSYAGLNVSELKKDNASSLVFELYREESGKNATSKELEERVEKVKYFEPAISVTRKVGEAYNEGKEIIGCPDTRVPEQFTVNLDLEKAFSPSSLDTFISCPRSFMFSRILDIPEPDEDKPFEVIAANETGTLAHSLMEVLANSDMSLDDFLKLSGEYFDRFLLQHPPLVMQNAQAEKVQFIDMMETAYNMDPHREVILKEEDISCVHESGISIHGYPDRVEKLDDGSYLIVDFKSGRNIHHQENDINTCLQVVIYAYLMEHNGYKVSGAEYRYIRLGETVKCKYDDEIKEQLNEKLKEFKEFMEKSEFPISELAINRTEDDPDPCAYCKYGMICGKESEMGGLGDE